MWYSGYLVPIIVILVLCCIGSWALVSRCMGKSNFSFTTEIHDTSDITHLFSAKAEALKQAVDKAITDAKIKISDIIGVATNKRTFENTIRVFDVLQATSSLAIAGNVLSVLHMVSPDESIRTTCQELLIQIADFSTSAINKNKALYEAIKAYANGNAQVESLTAEEKYFITKTLEEFERSGLGLPEEKLAVVSDLEKKVTALSLSFERNISEDLRTIAVPLEALAGLDKDLIASLKKNASGQYLVPTDTPVYTQVMEHCTVANTRKALYTLYVNRAYPANDALLQEIMAKRSAMASMIGFPTYAALSIYATMAHTPQAVEQFLQELVAKAAAKERAEFEALVQQLPEGVTLSAEGTIHPWDYMFVQSSYEKRFYDLDDRVVAEYFPVEHTLEALMGVYAKFFNLTFATMPVHGLWASDVRLVRVTERVTNNLLGYLLLDLFPRDNKFTHACHAPIIPAHAGDTPSLGAIIANFPRAMGDKPALLTRQSVSTFFHELGHALHSMFGKTAINSFSGTSVKFDFVEVPSQLFEQWLFDKDILRMISSHYKTGEPLPDTIIDRIITTKNLFAGYVVLRQSTLSHMSLSTYQNTGLSPAELLQQAYKQTPLHVMFSPENHMFASFGHLTDYGARYYSYLWSKVYSLDLFAEIRSHGLLNPEIGKKLVDDILSRGGSQEPHDLLVAFLGREPNQEAFLRDMGLEQVKN